MKNQKKVTLVVPTYNQAQYLGQCLDSIYFQDYPNLEIIIVNDCSSDDSNEVINQFLQALSQEEVSFASNYNESTNEIGRTVHQRYNKAGRQIVVLQNEVNLGSTKTYNRGFEAATGDYCTYIASDDLCHPLMISTMVDVMETKDVDFVYSDAFVVDDVGRILREMTYPEFSIEACFGDWYRCGVSKLYKRELHQRFGFYNNDYLANDHELYQKFALAGVRFAHVSKVLYSVRIHQRDREVGVHSSANWEKLMNESKYLVSEIRKIIKK